MKTCTKCGMSRPFADFYGKGDGRLSGSCKVCHNAAVVKWQAANRDKVRGYVRKACKKAYDADPQKGRDKSAARRAAAPEQVRAVVRKSFNKRYREKYDSERTRLNEYSARRRTSTPTWLTAIERAQTREFYDIARAMTCQTGVKHHGDHIEPLNGASSCGLHVPWNLQILTAAENCRKKNAMVGA